MLKISDFFSSLVHQCYWYASKFITRRGLVSFLSHELETLHPDTRVLNVGAGGSLGRMIHRRCAARNIEHVHLDIDETKRPDVVGDITTVDFSQYRVDCVFLIEVLEHVTRPHKAIDNIYENLETPGKVIASVPFLFPIHERPNDYFRFTKYGLEVLFERFDEVEIRNRDSWASAVLGILVRIYFESNLPCKLLALLMSPLMLVLGPVTLLLDAAFKTDYATTGYVLVARKRARRSPEGEHAPAGDETA